MLSWFPGDNQDVLPPGLGELQVDESTMQGDRPGSSNWEQQPDSDDCLENNTTFPRPGKLPDGLHHFIDPSLLKHESAFQAARSRVPFSFDLGPATAPSAHTSQPQSRLTKQQNAPMQPNVTPTSSMRPQGLVVPAMKPLPVTEDRSRIDNPRNDQESDVKPHLLSGYARYLHNSYVARPSPVPEHETHSSAEQQFVPNRDRRDSEMPRWSSADFRDMRLEPELYHDSTAYLMLPGVPGHFHPHTPETTQTTAEMLPRKRPRLMRLREKLIKDRSYISKSRSQRIVQLTSRASEAEKDDRVSSSADRNAVVTGTPQQAGQGEPSTSAEQGPTRSFRYSVLIVARLVQKWI